MPFTELSVQWLLLAVSIFMNLMSYGLYYSDKKRAQNRKQRISEKTLLFVSFFFGGLGAWLAMKQFRHKTKQRKFKLLVPIAALLTVGAIYVLLNLN